MNSKQERLSESTDKTIAKGRWNENITWEFIVTTNPPPENLCTAVCAVTTYDKKVLLVRNKRGWELPAGKIDYGETAEDAIRREVHEETGAVISDPKMFGYKKLTAIQPVPRPDSTNSFYPFPHSYVVFFSASADSINNPTGNDIQESILIGYDEAQTLLFESGQYTNILEYLRAEKIVDIA